MKPKSLEEILQAVMDSMNEYAPSETPFMGVEEAKLAILSLIIQELPEEKCDPFIDKSPLATGCNSAIQAMRNKLESMKGQPDGV